MRSMLYCPDVIDVLARSPTPRLYLLNAQDTRRQATREFSGSIQKSLIEILLKSKMGSFLSAFYLLAVRKSEIRVLESHDFIYY